MAATGDASVTVPGSGSDVAAVVVVLAKQPRAGRSKTRLQSLFTPAQAAELAAASLGDTLAVVRSCRAGRRVLAWEGDPAGYDAGFEVVGQPTGSLNDRLAAAFRDAGRPVADEDGGVLLIGMDTPQVTAALLDVDWQGADALLGPSEDGGFWAIGLRDVDPGAVFAGIPMSSDQTGAAQLARLHELGLSVRLLPPLRDVDTPEDAAAVAAGHPGLGFSARYRTLLDEIRRPGPLNGS